MVNRKSHRPVSGTGPPASAVGQTAEDRPRILLVDDNATVVALLKVQLGPFYQLQIAHSGTDGLHMAMTDPPDLVLLDVEMPDLDGYEVCRRLKAEPSTSDIPVVFLTSRNSQSEELSGLSAGASDFIAKPPCGPVVVARIANLVNMKRLTDHLRMAALTDGLTGVANRAHFNATLAREWRRTLRNGTPLALMLIDVDHFKAYNDLHGHQTGDACLTAVAQTLLEEMHRPLDLVARYGGEEFVVVMPETDMAGARTVAINLLRAIDRRALPHGASPVAAHITASIGLSAFDASSTAWPERFDSQFADFGTGLRAEDLLKAADLGLYRAKASGRRRACALHIDAVHAPERAETLDSQTPNDPGQNPPAQTA